MARWDDQVRDHRFPIRDSVASARATENQNAEAGKMEENGEVGSMSPADAEGNEEIKRGERRPSAWTQPEPEIPGVVADSRLRSNTEHQNAYVTDASLSWGRNGGVESNHERNAPEIPQAAEGSSGFQSAPFAAAVDPMPTPLGRDLIPDSPHGAEGNWNSAAIFERTRIG